MFCSKPKKIIYRINCTLKALILHILNKLLHLSINCNAFKWIILQALNLIVCKIPKRDIETPVAIESENHTCDT